MNTYTTALASCCLALASLGAQANETTKQDAPMTKKTMTLEECKQQLSMEEKNGENKGAATMRQDKMCADMVKKDAKMMKGSSSDPMKK